MGRITGYSPTPMTNTLSSLTTEIFGLLANAVLLYALAKYHHLNDTTQYTAIITADNKQAIEMAQKYTTPINISEKQKAEYDIQKLLHLIHQQTPITSLING